MKNVTYFVQGQTYTVNTSKIKSTSNPRRVEITGGATPRYYDKFDLHGHLCSYLLQAVEEISTPQRTHVLEKGEWIPVKKGYNRIPGKTIVDYSGLQSFIRTLL